MYVDGAKVRILDGNLAYWEKFWFELKSANSRNTATFQKVQIAKALDFYADAEEDDLIYEDDLLYDYIYQLILKIHPKQLIKEKPSNLSLIIIKSDEASFSTFSNGFIILTTGFIAKCENEKMLVSALVQCISQIVLDYKPKAHTASLKTSKLLEKIKEAEVYFISELLKKDELLADDVFTNKISSVISYVAWQEYKELNYDYAIKLIDRIQALNLATERDYLLASKLIRATSNTEASNLKALQYIQKAKALGFNDLIDLNKEAGILYLRLNDKTQAKEAFLRYKNELLDLKKEGFDVAYDLEAVNQILFKNRMF